MISKQTKLKLENYIRKEITRNRIKIMEGTKVPESFVKYFNEFYGPSGLYPTPGRTSPITKQEIQKALDVLSKNRKGYSFAGDSVDREEIRDVMMDMGMLNSNYDENTSKLESKLENYIRKIVREESSNEWGTSLRSLLDGELAMAARGVDLNNYNERNKLIDKIEDRLMEADWISMSDGTTFTKSFKPTPKGR